MVIWGGGSAAIPVIPSSHLLQRDLEEFEASGSTGCPPKASDVGHFRPRAWGRGDGVVLVRVSGSLAGFSREDGWWTLPPDPTGSTGLVATIDSEQGFFVAGGCREDDAGLPTRRWSL